MKILIIAPSQKMGGIERALSVLANEWTKKAYTVVYVSCLKGKPFYQLDSKIEVIEPSFRRSSSFLNKILFYPRLLIFIRQSVVKSSPDRVVVYGDWFSPLSLLALLGTRFPVYISDRTIPNYPFKFPIPQLKKWLYPKSAGFIAQTNRSKVYKENIFGNKLRIKIVANALAQLDKSDLTTTTREKNILYVGRFEWEKDPEILIRAFKSINSDYPDWTLEMAGDGPLFNKMKLLADELELTNNIIFHGKVNKVEKLYAKASIFVLPSVIEGFPNAVIEAMSFSLPCICFSDIPFEDIIKPNINGIVLFKRDSQTLGQALKNLIENEPERDRISTIAKNIDLQCAPQKISKEILDFMNI